MIKQLLKIQLFLTLMASFMACEPEDIMPPSPLISNLSPTEFILGLDEIETLTITGENFGTDKSAIQVIMGSSNLSVQSVTNTSIEVDITQSTESGTVTVLVNGESTASSQAVTINPAHLILNFAPKFGTSGTEVTVTGLDFREDAIVTFGNNIIATTKFVSTTELQVIVPEGGETGRIKVTVSGKEIESRADFQVVIIPNVTEVIEVINPATGKIWMDRNLGASRAATKRDDANAFGNLYQWGRGNDGHEKRNSGITSILSNGDNPGHHDFIVPANNNLNDWRTEPNSDLWQGANGTNNPCPDGYRLPTQAEWRAETSNWAGTGSLAFSSPLKLVGGGILYRDDGALIYEGGAYYWSSSTLSRSRAVALSYTASTVSTTHPLPRAYGLSVRCIKD